MCSASAYDCQLAQTMSSTVQKRKHIRFEIIDRIPFSVLSQTHSSQAIVDLLFSHKTRVNGQTTFSNYTYNAASNLSAVAADNSYLSQISDI